MRMDENGDEVMGDCSPTKPMVHNYLFFQEIHFITPSLLGTGKTPARGHRRLFFRL
jgi:hypothetical protein